MCLAVKNREARREAREREARREGPCEGREEEFMLSADTSHMRHDMYMYMLSQTQYRTRSTAMSTAALGTDFKGFVR